MTDVLSVKIMRDSDAAAIESGTAQSELMMRAAKGVFSAVSWKAPVAIVCGKGNNGGDGKVLAGLLTEAGIDNTVFETEEPSPCLSLDGYGTVVDCLLGTGFVGDLRPEIEAAVDAINACSAYKVSVDINSGLNGDTGMAKKCVISDLTVSIGSYKPGHFLNMAKDVMKSKVNVDIGIPPVGEVFHLIEEADVKAALGVRANFSNKGTYGYCALIGGSTRYSGAIRLAYLADAAMRSGAGVVKIALPQSLVHDVTPHILESTLFPLADTRRKTTGDNDDLEAASTNDREVAYDPAQIDELISNVRCVTFGMGIGTGEGAADILMHLLTKYEGNLVIDADGLTLLSKLDRDILKGRKGCTVLTPHIKEFSRLSGKEISVINEDPIGNARQYAFDTSTILLLKGPSTIVTNGDIVYIVDRGCPGMATAGSGDVLSGIMSAVTSFVSDKCLAAAVAAYINGAAGELAAEKYGDISMTAGDTVSFIPKVTM